MKVKAAYDYDAQRWTTGAEAQEVRKQHLREEIALFRSDRGQAYADFINVDKAEALAGLEQELAALEADTAPRNVNPNGIRPGWAL